MLRTGMADFPNWYKDIGKLRFLLNPQVFEGRQLSDFTECYWSTPEAALGEIRAAGFKVISYAGAESFAGGMHTVLEELSLVNPKAYANVVQVAAETCESANIVIALITCTLWFRKTDVAEPDQPRRSFPA